MASSPHGSTTSDLAALASSNFYTPSPEPASTLYTSSPAPYAHFQLPSDPTSLFTFGRTPTALPMFSTSVRPPGSSVSSSSFSGLPLSNALTSQSSSSSSTSKRTSGSLGLSTLVQTSSSAPTSPALTASTSSGTTPSAPTSPFSAITSNDQVSSDTTVTAPTVSATSPSAPPSCASDTVSTTPTSSATISSVSPTSATTSNGPDSSATTSSALTFPTSTTTLTAPSFSATATGPSTSSASFTTSGASTSPSRSLNGSASSATSSSAPTSSASTALTSLVTTSTDCTSPASFTISSASNSSATTSNGTDSSATTSSAPTSPTSTTTSTAPSFSATATGPSTSSASFTTSGASTSPARSLNGPASSATSSNASTSSATTAGPSTSSASAYSSTTSSHTSQSVPTCTTPEGVSGKTLAPSTSVMTSGSPEGRAPPTPQTPHPPGPDEFTGQPDEIACDICDPNNGRYKAAKSCLMCSLSYCSAHLKMHQKNVRVKGHLLVAPCAEMDRRACLSHGRPLELYSVTEDRLICSLCVQEGMKIISVEKEREKRQKKTNHELHKMREKIQQREERMNQFNQSAATCVGLVKKEEDKIRKVFEDIKRLIKQAEEDALRPLVERKAEVEADVKDLVKELQAEISKFKNIISVLQQIHCSEDPVVFLQSYPNSIKINKDKDWSNVELNTSLTFGTMRNIMLTMMDDTKMEFEKLSVIETSRIKKFAVDVTLDPDTANPQLNISNNRKEVSTLEDCLKETGGDGDGGSDRFDLFGSILGSCWLTQGRAYWEVGVGYKRGWDIGVALEDANRKGELSLKPSQGYWVLVHYEGERYAALEDPPVSLHLQSRPRRVGVFVDFDEKLVSFYDVEDKSHLYSFKDCDLGGGVRPYFSPHLDQEEPLVICPGI